MKTYFYSFIVAMLFGISASVQTDIAEAQTRPTTTTTNTLLEAIDICHPDDNFNFQDSSYRDILLAIDDLVWATPESEAINNSNFFSRIWDSISGSQQRRQLYAEILGRSCDAEGNTPLHLAINEALEDSSAIEIDSSDPLHRLIRRDLERPKLDFINALINKYAPVNAANENGETPLDMIKRMMGAEDFSNEKMELYAFIYRQNQNLSLTYQNRRHNIFQRMCRSRYNYYEYVVIPYFSNEPADFVNSRNENEWKQWANEWRDHPLIKGAYYAFERLKYTVATQTVIAEHNQWLSTLPEIEKLPALMEVYQTLRSAEKVTFSDLHKISIPISTEARRQQLIEDDLRCSGRTSRYYGL